MSSPERDPGPSASCRGNTSILATAEYYGADGHTLQLLHGLRAARYASLTNVADNIVTGADVRERLARR